MKFCHICGSPLEDNIGQCPFCRANQHDFIRPDGTKVLGFSATMASAPQVFNEEPIALEPKEEPVSLDAKVEEPAIEAPQEAPVQEAPIIGDVPEVAPIPFVKAFDSEVDEAPKAEEPKNEAKMEFKKPESKNPKPKKKLAILLIVILVILVLGGSGAGIAIAVSNSQNSQNSDYGENVDDWWGETTTKKTTTKKTTTKKTTTKTTTTIDDTPIETTTTTTTTTTDDPDDYSVYLFEADMKSIYFIFDELNSEYTVELYKIAIDEETNSYYASELYSGSFVFTDDTTIQITWTRWYYNYHNNKNSSLTLNTVDYVSLDGYVITFETGNVASSLQGMQFTQTVESAYFA